MRYGFIKDMVKTCRRSRHDGRMWKVCILWDELCVRGRYQPPTSPSASAENPPSPYRDRLVRLVPCKSEVILYSVCSPSSLYAIYPGMNTRRILCSLGGGRSHWGVAGDTAPYSEEWCELSSLCYVSYIISVRRMSLGGHIKQKYRNNIKSLHSACN